MRTIPLLLLLTSACGTDSDTKISGLETTNGLPAACAGPEVHVIGVYETRSDHGFDYHPTGTATVRVERPGDHVLVLASYEPTDWTVELAAGAKVSRVHLVGYHAQKVNLAGAEISADIAEEGGEFACGYVLPSNGEGCETEQLLAIASERAGAAVTSFHGCYRATQWTLNADGSATSDCAVDEGYSQSDMFGSCEPGEQDDDHDCGGTGDWEALDFATLGEAACDGARYVRFDAKYGLFVGAILCGSADRYKLYLSGSALEPFLEIADYAGHGQDHCELVNPAFTIPDEDDITSGGCTSCSVGDVIDLIGVPVYARGVFGEPFERVVSTDWADLTNPQYSCGVSIP